jgi:hypothetical protein
MCIFIKLELGLHLRMEIPANIRYWQTEYFFITFPF